MELSKYLEDILISPDDLLTSEYGIYDNWAIHVAANFEEMATFFMESVDYEFDKELEHQYSTKYFSYKPGTVRIQLRSQTPEKFPIGTNIEHMYSLKEYHSTIMLHPYLENKIENTTDERALVEVIHNISLFLRTNKIKSCFPNSIGWDYTHVAGLSNVVFYNP